MLSGFYESLIKIVFYEKRIYFLSEASRIKFIIELKFQK